MTKFFSLSLVLGVLLSGCASQRVSDPSGSETEASRVSHYGYEPIDPVSTPQVFIFDSPGKGGNKLWADMTPGDIRSNLPNQTSTTTIKKLSGDAKGSYLTAIANAEAGSYEVVMDYAKYRSEPLYEDASGNVSGVSDSSIVSNSKIIGYGKIGIGVRIRANVETLKSGVDLNGLFALGLAAKQQSLRGTISVEVIGIDSKSVNALLPVGVQLDESSIQASLQSLASIQTKIYDDDPKVIKLTPHLIAIRYAAKTDFSGKTAKESKIIQRSQGLRVD